MLQRDILAGCDVESSNNVLTYDSLVEIDVLTFQGPIHRGVRELIRRVNPYTACKCTKDQYEESFKRLSSLGLGKVSEEKSRNKKKTLVFEKLSIQEIAQDPLVLDRFPKQITYAEYESKRL